MGVLANHALNVLAGECTIADLAGEPRVGALRLAEALQYRTYESRHREAG